MRCSWQSMLFGIFMATCCAPVFAQKADFAGAARAATQGADFDSAFASVPPNELTNMRNQILRSLPASDRTGFDANTPAAADDKYNYYKIVQKCMAQGWPKNCLKQ